MPIARKKQISLVDTKYYHCISRCVRRAFLCGKDISTGKSYEHRKQWVEDKILFLATVFCIDICAYAVMSNHLHIVLHVDNEKAKILTDREVVLRWHQLFKGTLLTQKYLENEDLNQAQKSTLQATIAVYRRRLFDISWFMRILNEHISRRANKEDGCTGHFWEGRFKSQALLDEAALLACMAYVDLNPIRAKTAKTIAKSNHTSVKARFALSQKGKQPENLMRFKEKYKKAQSKNLPFELESYLEIIELTSQSIQNKTKKLIKKNELLNNIGIESDNWLTLTTNFSIFRGAVGHEQQIIEYAEHLQIRRKITIAKCRRLFG